MSAIDDRSNPPPIFGAIPRRGFLKYLSAVFATAALPEALAACSNLDGSASGGVGTTAEGVDFTSVPMFWVTRKSDNLSLGFQFSGLAPDANHDLNLASGTTAGNAYVAITFPPQHVIEDAVAAGATDTLPLNAYASGTSRLVFQVPASYGTTADAGGIPLVPYTLQGVLELCAQCPLIVAPNAMSDAGETFRSLGVASHPSARPAAASFAEAKIDRVLAKVDRAAAKRVVSRLKPELIVIGTTHYGTTPVAPTNGQTSIELPHRLLISPNELTAFSYPSAPVTSPGNRTELWSARMGLRNTATGLADPSLGGLDVRALWTRDYEVVSASPVALTAAEPGVANAVLVPWVRDRLVQDTGNMAGSVTPPLAVSRLMLSPLGGTMDVSASFPSTDDQPLQAWAQQIALGRDEFVQTVTVGTLLPFGHPAAVVKINKRCDNPSNGNAVGTIYNVDYVVVGQPLMSYQGLANQSDFNRFPFTAVELTQTKIPCSINVGNGVGWVSDPTGATTPWVAAIGTDHKGRAIKFKTALIFVPAGTASYASAMAMWNGGGDGGPGFDFEGQRIAFAPPPSPSNASPSTNTDSTSFETHTMAIVLETPSTTSTIPIVPWARSIQVSLDAVRHLTTSTASGAGTPNSLATFDYDTTAYAANGFTNPSANPNEVFFTLSANVANNAPALSFSGDASRSGALVTPNMGITALSRASGPMGGTTSLFQSGFSATDFFAGFNPELFGFLPLASIIQAAAASMPKIVSQQFSNAESFIQSATVLYQTASTLNAQLTALSSLASSDATAYANLLASGLDAAGLPLTAAESAALSATESAAKTASTTIASYESAATTIGNAATAVGNDVTGQQWSALLGTTGMNGDLGTLLTSVTALLNDIAALKSASTQAPGQAAAAAASYLQGLGNTVTNAVTSVNTFLSEATQLLSDLNTLAQGLELPSNLSVSFDWTPQITGLEYGGLIAFVPSSPQALSLNVVANATAVNGQPAGANITCRLDQFAIAFGSIPGTSGSGYQTYGASIPTVKNGAAVTLTFDHMQFQMLAGQKPDVDVVFSSIDFGGSLKFIETLKNLLPLDAFSDPPFLDLTASGITAGFNLAVPNVAIGMFSLENMTIDAALTMPFITVANGPAGTPSGVSFSFDFSTIDNPFLVTVAMLGGGGFFQMQMDMTGLTSVGLGVQVSAQLAFNFLDIVSGCLSIDVGIFLSYNKSVTPGEIDPVTGLTAIADSLVLGGYLRLRGALDVAGIITIAVELYLQITYVATGTEAGKCTASGFIQIDVSLLFFSLHEHIPFSRTFAGSNGDPTFVQLMGVGTPAVDPMLDPAHAGQPVAVSAVANPTWDPFADYCMAFA